MVQAACSTANQFKDEIFWHPADEVLCGFSAIIGFIYSSQSLLNSQGGLSHFAMRQAHRGHYRGPKSLTLKAARTLFFSRIMFSIESFRMWPLKIKHSNGWRWQQLMRRRGQMRPYGVGLYDFCPVMTVLQMITNSGIQYGLRDAASVSLYCSET